MTTSPAKPAVIAGFSAFLVGSIAFAQDYIDVEAEREAARRASQPQRVQSSPAPVYSDPVGTATPEVGQETDSESGFRPYSGRTVTVTPIETVDTGVSAGGSSNGGSLVIQVQQLQEEVRRLNGRVEEQAEEIQRLKEQSLERYVDLDRRLSGSASAPAVNEGAGATVDPKSVAVGQPDPIASSGPAQPGEEAAYQGAYDLVKARRFPAAVDAFKGFLADYPFGRYAPNAHYWLGELYLVTDPPDPELARQSFQLLLDQYPDNPKIPDALYKLGRVHFLKGNPERSRSYLDRVIKTYPGHPAAQLAQDFLDQNF